MIFSFQKSNREFSRMALDQIHEQNNRVIKSCAGAVDLVNKVDESALIRWETCDHDIARIINEFKESVTDDYYNHNSQKHHEDNDRFCSKFDNDVKTLVIAIPVNLFQIDNLCKINNTKYVVPDEVFHMLKSWRKWVRNSILISCIIDLYFRRYL